MTPPATRSARRREARYRQQTSWRLSVINLLWLLRIPVILLGVVGLVWLTVLVVRWLQPLRPPQLLVISSEYQHPQLPVNAFARQDASELLSQVKLFDIHSGDAEGRSLNLVEMQQLVGQIAKLPRRQSILFWQKATNIVYVNALGVAVREELDSPRAKAYLLPSDFDAADTAAGLKDHALPVSELLQSLSRSDADYKLLVLDCQRVDQVWPLGVISNQFVETVSDELSRLGEADRTRYAGLFVLFSGSAGEVTWTDNRQRNSAFARHFMQGLRGAADGAGDRDGRISLQEVADYVRTRTDAWVSRNRADRQRPLLLHATGDAAQAKRVMLATCDHVLTVALSNRASPDVLDVGREAHVDHLEKYWRRYYEMSRGELHPTHYAPQLWRKLEAVLLRAEALFRADDLTAMAEELDKFEEIEELLQTAKLTPLDGQPAYSLPMLELFGHDYKTVLLQQAAEDKAVEASSKAASAPTAAGVGEDKAAGKSGTAESPAAGGQKEEELSPREALAKAVQIVKDIETPQQLQAAGQTLRESSYQAITLPVEAELIRLMAEYGPSLGPDAQPELMGKALQAVRLLKKAEEAAVPASKEARQASRRYAPRIFAWIRQDVDQADYLRRIGEDKFFASGAERAPVGGVASSNVDRDVAEEEMLYDRALQDAEIVGSAIRHWERAMAELPYLVRLASSRIPVNPRTWKYLLETYDRNDDRKVTLAEYSDGDEHFQDCDRDGNGELTVEDFGAGNIGSFHNTIAEKSAELLLRLQALSAALWSQPPDRVRIDSIKRLSDEVQETRTSLLTAITIELDEILRSLTAEAIATGIVWRQIDALLEIPFVGTTSEVDSMLLAKQRVKLLHLVGGSTSHEPSAELERKLASESAQVDQPDVDLTDAPRTGYESSVRLALNYYELIHPAPVETETDLKDGFSRAVANAWKDCYVSLETQDEKRLRQADVASRILAPHLTASSDRAFNLLGQQQWAEFLAWHAQRRAEDFWAGRSRIQKPYFQATAEDYLALSQQLAPQADREARAGLRRLASISKKFGGANESELMQALPADSVFRGTDEELVEIALPAAEIFPPGFARLRLSAEDKSLGIEPLSASPAEAALIDSASRPYPFEITRSTLAGFKTTLTPELFFRGHIAQLALPLIGASEVDGPTTVYQSETTGETQLVVRLSEVIPNPIEVLFVLDCSRSMLEDGRLQALRESLLKFAGEASEIGLNVGIRVFGDRVIWQKSDAAAEAQARQDTRILLPVNEFRREEFQNAVNNLEAKGESPLFFALKEARGDFTAVEAAGNLAAENNLAGGKKPVSRQRIVVISDGEDNWARIGEKPGLDELREAYRDSNISINTIGFQIDESGNRQLQQIAALGGGTAVQVEQSDELLTQVLGLTKAFRYEVYQSAAVGFSTLLHSDKLDFSGERLAVLPGDYEVRVVDAQGTLITERSAMRIQAGQLHELLFDGGKLDYPAANIEQDVAAQRDANSGMLLRVLRAALLPTNEEDHGKPTLELDVAIADEKETNVFPQDVQFRIQPQGSPRVYTFQDQPSNVPGYHFLVWRLRLENWPEDILNVNFDASWLKAAEADRVNYLLAFQDTGELRMLPAEVRGLKTALPAGIRLTRRKFAPYPVGKTMQNAATVTLVFPRDYAGSIEDWSFTFNKPISFARQTYNSKDGIYTGHYTFRDGEPPAAVIVRGPHAGDQRSTLGTAFSLRLRKIN